MTGDTVTLAEKKAYLKQMKEKRKFLLDYHKVLVAEDLPFMKAITDVLTVGYSNQRILSKKVKDLIFTVILAAVGGTKEIVKLHIDLAKKEGATKEEVLEAIEILVLPCGLPKFFIAYEAWTECFEVSRVELD